MDPWEVLEQECLNCQKCGLCAGRNHVVFGVGDRNADLMLIGEGPGEQEDLRGEPFVGPAGQLLDDMLSIIDITRQDCYIANIVKCHPPRNRDPMEQEQDACFDYLRRQIELVKPKIILCLGRIAAQRIIRPDFRITREHGTWVEKDGIWLSAIYHPSALLRDLGKRPETFEDLLRLRQRLQVAKVCRPQEPGEL